MNTAVTGAPLEIPSHNPLAQHIQELKDIIAQDPLSPQAVEAKLLLERAESENNIGKALHRAQNRAIDLMNM